MEQDCVFCKIADKQIPTKILLENQYCLAFNDIKPRAKIHILVIPKKHIPTVNDLTPEDETIMGNMLLMAKDITKKLNLLSYKLLISVGKEAGQEIFHIHMHIMSPH